MSPSVGSDCVTSEFRQLIRRKIDSLPQAFRTVFVLRGIEELSVAEVARALDVPTATVRTRYFRARSLLRESLSREPYVAMDGYTTVPQPIRA